MLNSTRQQAMPVGEFVDRVPSCDQEVEGNLCTIFQNMCGSVLVSAAQRGYVHGERVPLEKYGHFLLQYY